MYLLISTRSIVDGNEPENSTLGLVNVIGKAETIGQCVALVIKDMDQIMIDDADNYVDKNDIEGYNDFMSKFYQEIVHEDLLAFDKEENGQAYLAELELNLDECIDQVDYFVYRL